VLEFPRSNAERLIRLARSSMLPTMSQSVDFFESQFQRQVRDREFELNPFERLSLDYLQGAVLDLGCGMGNLAIEAARRGCTVTAVDGSPTAIARIRSTAQQEQLMIEAIEADLKDFQIANDYDTIVSIGLLMFFRESRAHGLLGEIENHVRPGGRAVVNVLIEGTTFMDMFTPGEYYLFRREELVDRLAAWRIEVTRFNNFPAPGDTIKSFATVIARKPVK
jgi:tellurite methyltransferase